MFSVLRVVNIVPFMPSFSVPFIGFGFDAVVVPYLLLALMRSDQPHISTYHS